MKGWQTEQFQLGFGKPYTDSGVVESEVGLGSFSLIFDLLHLQSTRVAVEAYWCRHLATLQVEHTKTQRAVPHQGELR